MGNGDFLILNKVLSVAQDSQEAKTHRTHRTHSSAMSEETDFKFISTFVECHEISSHADCINDSQQANKVLDEQASKLTDDLIKCCCISMMLTERRSHLVYFHLRNLLSKRTKSEWRVWTPKRFTVSAAEVCFVIREHVKASGVHWYQSKKTIARISFCHFQLSQTLIKVNNSPHGVYRAFVQNVH